MAADQQTIERVAAAICKTDLSSPTDYGDEICCQYGRASRRAEGGHNYPDKPGSLRCCREDFIDHAIAAIEAMAQK